MSWRGMKLLVHGALLLVWGGCTDLGDQVPLPGEWALYRLKDTTLTTDEVLDRSLEWLELEGRPYLTARDLVAYDWQTHAIELMPGMDQELDSLARRAGTTRGRPFVITVGGERIYLGTFWWAYSSSMAQCPFIELLSARPRRIQLPVLHQGSDPRADGRIYGALRASGVLRRATPNVPVPLERDLVADNFGDHDGVASAAELRFLEEYFAAHREAWCICSYGGLSPEALTLSGAEAKGCFSVSGTHPYESEEALRAAWAGKNIRTLWVSIVVVRAGDPIALIRFYRSPGPGIARVAWDPLTISP